MRGKLIVVSGPSGAGKSTLIKEVLENVPGIAYSVSATTRAPREGEADGREYLFVSREEFERWISEGRFLEWAEYSGNLYGTPEHPVEEFMDNGRSVILEIELKGARKVREKRPDAVMVFIKAPSEEENRRRLEDRGTETSEAMDSRMETAAEELSARDEFDYELTNDEPETSRENMLELMQNIVKGEGSAERA